jgi:hypothetical protein
LLVILRGMEHVIRAHATIALMFEYSPIIISMREKWSHEAEKCD